MTAMEIIQNCINDFLEDITYLSGQNRKKCISNMSQFQVFEKVEDPFYKQECLMDEVKDGIRRQLVIECFLGLLKCDNLLRTKIHLKQVVSTNKKYEKLDNYEYDDKTKILFSIDGTGYRFTTPLEDGVNQLLKDYELSKIAVINFLNQYQNSNNENVIVLSLKDFFDKYFLNSEKLYNVYFRIVTDAIEKAKKMIGYKTIFVLSMPHLNEFKSSLLSGINNLDFSTKVYISKNIVKNVVEYKEVRISYSKQEFDEILIRFKNNISTLTSEENYAKCFITAEHLYQTIKEQNSFDYTSIVCGYLKAIEELLYWYHTSTYINDNHYFLYKECGKKCKSEDNCIIYNKRKNQNEKCRYYNDSCFYNEYKKKYYSFGQSNAQIAIGGLVLQLMLNDELCLVSNEIKNSIWLCFDDYCKTCRNEHFHKDNIYDWEEVERIRNNTYMCIFYLLGAFSTKNNQKISVYSDEYSRLYKSFNNIISSIKCFIIERKNGEVIYAMRPFKERIESPEYDQKTAEIITPIILLRVKSFSDYDYGNRTEDFETIIINKNSIPKRMYWYINDKKHEIKW